jgi:hypothetical protein
MGKNSLDQQEEVSFPPVEEQEVFWGHDKSLHKANRYKAIVDSITGKLFSIVSQDYRLIRHQKAIEQVEEAIKKTPDLGKCEAHTSFYNAGGRMRRDYVFPDITVEISSGDDINPELQLYNSYDTTWPFIVILGAFRLICTNGLVIREKFLHLRKRHIVNLDNIELKEQVSTALERFNRQAREWREWSDRQLTVETYKQFMEVMQFGKNATKEINKRSNQEAEKLDENGFPIMSLWAFYNVLTRHITHRAVSLNHRVEMERRLRATLGYLKS